MKTDQKTIERQKNYNHSEKGQQTRKNYYANNKEKLLAYNKDYLKKRREQCRAEGICYHCLKRPQTQNTTLCDPCRETQRKYLKNYKEKEPTETYDAETT